MCGRRGISSAPDPAVSACLEHLVDLLVHPRADRRAGQGRAGRSVAGVEGLSVPSRVYVIELKPAAGRRRDPRIPWVYVGSSARDPEIRFAQHRRGYRSSGIVKRFALRLRPDLYDDLGPIKGSKRAVATEQQRARELATCGFVAHCDGTSHGREGGAWREWDGGRLARCAAHVETAVATLRECAFEPLDRVTCARLLWGERGFWIERYIDAADPPPPFGLFSHVESQALGRFVDECYENVPGDGVLSRPAG